MESLVALNINLACFFVFVEEKGIALGFFPFVFLPTMMRERMSIASAKQKVKPFERRIAGPPSTRLLVSSVAATVLLVALLYYILLATTESTTSEPHAAQQQSPNNKKSSERLSADSDFTDACRFTNRSIPAYRRQFRLLTEKLLSFGPRVGGSSTSGYFGVMNLLVELMQCSDALPTESPHWSVSFDNFSSPTPLGVMSFTNLISTIENPFFAGGGNSKDLNARLGKRRFPLQQRKDDLPTVVVEHMVLAAHWDSKLMSGTPFLGACDSAVPIAIILEVMKIVSHILKEASEGNELWLHAARHQIPRKITVIFFDGEEAFVEWKGDDHTYGSRHLAKLWKDQGLVANIDLFVLLDLIGPKGPSFHNYFPQDSGAFYEKLRLAENGLRSEKKLSNVQSYFPNEPTGFPHRVDDDHIHWVDDVSVLHLIPLPFPKTWHTPQDDAKSIDYRTVVDVFSVLVRGLFGVHLT